MKTMAGSIDASSRASISSVRRGTARRSDRIPPGRAAALATRRSRSRPAGSGLPWRSTGTSSTCRVPRSASATWLTSSTGRARSTTTSVGPRTEAIQAPSCSALDTVADRQTKLTPGGARMRTSSHTEPR